MAGIVSLVLALAIVAGFVGGLRPGIVGLLLIRPLCDRIFELSRFDLAGKDISYGAAINVVVIVAIGLVLYRLRNRVQITLWHAWVPFLLVTLIAVFYSPVAVDAFRKFLTYVSYMAMFALPFVLVKTERDALFFFKVIILSSLAPVAYGLFQLASGWDWYQDARIASTFSHPNIFAFYLLTTIATIFSLLLSQRFQLPAATRKLLGAYLIPLLILLVATKTRSAWLGCVIIFTVYGLIADKRVLVMTLALPLLALFVPAVRERLADLSTGNEYVGWVQDVNAYAWRKLLWTKAVAYIAQRPLFGYGLYSFPYYSPSFFPLETERGVDAHNVYVQLLFETGIMGLLSYLWIFVRQFQTLLRYLKLDRPALAMSMTMICVYLVTCYSDNILEYVSYGWCYWFTFGIIFADLSQYRVSVLSPGQGGPDNSFAGAMQHVRTA
jgi:O-antigen ligase